VKKYIAKIMTKKISISFFKNMKKNKKTVNLQTHGFVNTVYNRKRQRSAILHKTVVSLAVFS